MAVHPKKWQEGKEKKTRLTVAKLFALTDVKRQCLKDVAIDSPASG